MKQSYLPSKDFTKKLLLVGCFLVFGFIIYKAVPYVYNKFSKENRMKQMLVKDIVQQDSNSNGIADWEETLWGLDPLTNGPENKKIIEEKKSAIANSGDDSYFTGDPNNITDSEKLARELLPLIVSLQQNGTLNDNALNVIAGEVGKKIDEKAIDDIYTKEKLKIVADNSLNNKTYYSKLKLINDKYEGADIGNELTFISQGLKNTDEQAFNAANQVADAYSEYSKDLMTVSVPQSMVTTHLALANNYEKNALAIKKVTKVFEDPLIGMTGIVQYKRYNEALMKNFEELESFFIKNGILK